MNPYDRLYGYGLLDDIHNLFPDLLYGDRPLSSEFQYIRDQTRRLFPTRYAQGQLEYRTAPSNLESIQYIISMLQPNLRINRWHHLLAYVDDINIDDIQMQPVVVRPTPEQINEATSITPHTEVEASNVCTICQDHGSVEETPEWREIDRCGHIYHKKCIDRWFETSVQCPICRMDIRD
jgi:hypothetical protein